MTLITTETLFDRAVLRIVLDAPKANILDTAMITAIRCSLEEDVHAATKLVVFEGAGDHFSFGASVNEHQRSEAPAMLETFHGLFRALARLAVPTCAVVRGCCLGGGLELASWCTYVVCTPKAKLGQPEIKLAVFPPMASILLPWRCGGGAALDLCVSGRTVGGEEAFRLGLVSAVAEDPEGWWHDRFRAELEMMSALGLRMAERAARAGLMSRLEQELPALERFYLEEVMATRDANEGITAFMERRRPVYTNS